jgi:hypothetical protein
MERVEKKQMADDRVLAGPGDDFLARRAALKGDLQNPLERRGVNFEKKLDQFAARGAGADGLRGIELANQDAKLPDLFMERFFALHMAPFP